MIKSTNKLTEQRGTSLLEVMIALVITGVVTMAIFKAYIAQHKNYLAQEDVTDIQQNTRAAINELAKHIRMAGYDLPSGIDAITPSNTNPDTITISYSTSGCDTYLVSPMPQPSAELKCATDISCFNDGQWVYIFEPGSGDGEWFVITEVQTAAMHLQHNTMSLSKSYSQDAVIFPMKQIKFFVDTTSDPDHPNLMLQLPGQQPMTYAMNIADLQFQYRMKNGVVADQPVLISDVREVLISLTGRSRNPDPDRKYDQYRQRTFSTSVSLRNI